MTGFVLVYELLRKEVISLNRKMLTEDDHKVVWEYENGMVVVEFREYDHAVETFKKLDELSKAGFETGLIRRLGAKTFEADIEKLIEL